MQLHGQGEHCGGTFGLGARHGSCACNLLQRTSFGARLDLGDLGTKLVFALLGFLELTSEVGDLSGLLLNGSTLLLGLGKLAGQLLVGRTELIALLLDGGNLLANSLLVAGSLSGLSGQLVDLSIELIDLTLELIILRRQSTVGLLRLAQFGSSQFGGLSVGLGTGLRLCCSVLQIGVFGLQLLHLTGQLGNLSIQIADIRIQRLSGLTAGDCLTPQSLNRFGDLIEEVIDLVNIVAFLETNGLEGVLPNIFRRQQSHKSCTSLWGIARAYVAIKSKCYHDLIVYSHFAQILRHVCRRKNIAQRR